MIGLRSIAATTRFQGAVAGVPDYPLAANASGRALRSPKTAFMRSESVSFRPGMRAFLVWTGNCFYLGLTAA
jgi:hypothetical protein